MRNSAEPFVEATTMSLPGPGNDFRELFSGFASVPSPQTAWQPAADLYRCERGWLVKFDLAGVCEEDIELTLRGSTLMIRGCRRDIHLEPHREAHRLEIAYSHFSRLVELPEVIQPSEIRTEYRDGMLLVRILPAPT
jgi:HSP20 family protein